MTARYQRPRTGREGEDSARQWPERIDLRISIRIDLRMHRLSRREPPSVLPPVGSPLLDNEDDGWAA